MNVDEIDDVSVAETIEKVPCNAPAEQSEAQLRDAVTETERPTPDEDRDESSSC